MEPVLQEEKTGCAIASSAAIAGISYIKAKKIAKNLGISADNKELWSQTDPIRKLLNTLKINTHSQEVSFHSWESLPDCALLSIKWHLEADKPYWHWVVFIRDDSGEYVLDSSNRLKNNIRTDFGRMRPKWFIEILNKSL
ncbi:MAG: hypothetical protein V3U71_07195 [Cocleimonas sp.]